MGRVEYLAFTVDAGTELGAVAQIVTGANRAEQAAVVTAFAEARWAPQADNELIVYFREMRLSKSD